HKKETVMNFFRLGQRGHAHFIMPLVAIVGVAAIGTAYLALTHGQTLSCAQLASGSNAFQYSANPTVPYNKDGTKAGVTYGCVGYINQMWNAADAYSYVSNEGASYINSLPASDLNASNASGTAGSPGFDVTHNFGSVSHTYSMDTHNYIVRYQEWINARPTKPDPEFNITSAAFTKAFMPHGNLPTTGTVESKTMYSLCQFVDYGNALLNASKTNHSTDYTSSGKKTNTWYFRSYMRAGYSAANSAGCKALLNPPKSTSGSWTLTASTSTSVSTVTAGSTVTFKSAITNNGPDASTSFNYGARYFYSSTSTPTHPANGGYVGEMPASGHSTESSLPSYNKSTGKGVLDVTQSVPVPTSTTAKYICGTVAFGPYSSSGAANGRSAAKCIPIAPQTTTAATWSLTGATVLTNSGANSTNTEPIVTFSSTITNTGQGISTSFKYGPRYFYATTATPKVQSNGTYAGETTTVADATYSSLASGKSIGGPAGASNKTPITQSITIPSTEKSAYICGTAAFTPYNSAGGANGRSKAFCLSVSVLYAGLGSTGAGK
ncbi:MAG TPA: hypothetical protein VMB52_01930, partial [Verrucomicrobiae bacterium]|nr:hypothetical protein [Verrucomicrobiae bacterium]